MSVVFGYDGLFKEMTRYLILNTKLLDDGILMTINRRYLNEHVSSIITGKYRGIR